MTKTRWPSRIPVATWMRVWDAAKADEGSASSAAVRTRMRRIERTLIRAAAASPQSALRNKPPAHVDHRHHEQRRGDQQQPERVAEHRQRVRAEDQSAGDADEVVERSE